jgi:hypothetical protein
MKCNVLTFPPKLVFWACAQTAILNHSQVTYYLLLLAIVNTLQSIITLIKIYCYISMSDKYFTGIYSLYSM